MGQDTDVAQLDIVIPVYNEGENIIQTLTQIREWVKTPCRILICYDFEEDTTLKAIEQHDLKPLQIEFVLNSGQGPHGAIMSGFEASRAPAVLVMPADDHFNSGILDKMVKLQEEGCDIVTASRFLPGGCMEGCAWLKDRLVRTAAFLLHNFAAVPSCDPTSGFRLFSSRVVKQIPVESKVGFAFSLELLVKVHRLGWRVGQVPALWYEREHGQSRFRVIRWLPQYLRWFFYAFATRWLRIGPETVRLRGRREGN